MSELAILLVIVVALMAVTTTVATRIDGALRIIERFLLYSAIGVILFVMAFVTAEVVMRYAFNSPIPGHLEGSELLLPIIVYFAISYTQSVRGHVGMDLVLDMMAPKARRYATAGTLLFSLITCAVLSYFSFKAAYQLWDYDDVTMTPPYWRTWPAGAAVPIGYFLISVRMYLQILQSIAPDRFPMREAEDTGMRVSE